jgi:hypothetical protein
MMFFAFPGTRHTCQITFAAPEFARGAQGEIDPVTDLEDAVQAIETAAYELADQHPSDVIAQLILAAAELERILTTIKGKDRGYRVREN